MFFIPSKNEKILKSSGISSNLINSNCYVFNITNINISQEELKERFSEFELIVYSYNNNKILDKYREAHNGNPFLLRVKEIQRINNINFESLIDLNKKAFKVFLILPLSKEKEVVSFLEDFGSSVRKAIMEKTLNFFPKNEASVLKNNRIEFKEDSLVSFDLELNSIASKSLLDILIKTQHKTSFFYYKVKYNSKGLSFSLFLKNKELSELNKDVYSFKLNALKFNYNLIEKTSHNSLLNGLPTIQSNKVFKNDFQVLRIPKYLKASESRMNILLEDKIERVFGLDLFKDEKKNFLIADYGGAGKTFFLKNLFFNYLLDNTKIRLIDHYGEFSSFVKLFGGIEYKLSSYNSFKLFKDDEELSKEELLKISSIIFSLTECNSEVKKEILDAIKKSFIIYNSESSLATIVKVLKKSPVPGVKKVISDLYDFYDKKGEFYFLFNGTEFFNFSNDLISFNLDLLDERVIEAVNIYIFSNFNKMNRKRIVFTNNLHNKDKSNLINYLNNTEKDPQTAYGFDGLDFKGINNINTYIYGSSIAGHSSSFSKETINLLSMLRSDIPNYSEFLLIQGRKKEIVKLKVNLSLKILFSSHPDDIDRIAILAKGLGKSIEDIKFKESFLAAAK